ncbi:MAG: T9SS type A sorting domain-containing protein [candidate division WOR-3 bacterium]|nr:T9SS type A sorting domain-containing protein [candidate division WOR-3 bacterium]MDW8113531.1 T9SS type A sorting domain-containing protein [candidate division WOR-3 bacterium]
MKKYLLISFLFLSLIFASERELSYIENFAIPCPIPQPEIIPLPPADENSPDLDTLMYDENIRFNAWAWNTRGNGWGMKFISPAPNIRLKGALVMLWDTTWPVPGGRRFLIRVLKDDGPNGAPGTLIYQSDTILGTRGAWNFVLIDTPIVNSNFYIFYIQPDSYPLCPGLCIDGNSNAPDNVLWQFLAGSYSVDKRRGEWMMRAVIDWTPQNNNLMTTVFGAMPFDTIPRISFTLRATVRNIGTQTISSGVPVKLRIVGPQGYVYEDIDQTTTTNLARRQSQTITFTPAWRIPDTSGTYQIIVWHEFGNDEYRFNDTIRRSLGIASWITYANWNNPAYLTWAGPQRATRFNPADFRLTYPFQITRIRHQFYWHQQYPWPDSIFRFRIYADDGQTLLYESDTIRAVSYPLSIEHAVEPPVTINSGTFYIAVMPRSYSGHPSTLADNQPLGKSFYGSPGSWMSWTYGEYFNAVSVRQLTAVEEIDNYSVEFDVKEITNPKKEIKIKWQIPKGMWVKVTLNDVAGRVIRYFYKNAENTSQKGVISLDSKTLSKGVYLIHFETPSYKKTKKIVLF